MSVDPTTKCDWDGAEFTPAAENFCEGGFEAFEESAAIDASEKWKGEAQPLQEISLNAEEQKTLKAALGITDEQADELTRTGELKTAFVLCDNCMNDESDDSLADEYCDHCGNTGIVICYCGGDLCVCNNNGEMDCPYCA